MDNGEGTLDSAENQVLRIVNKNWIFQEFQNNQVLRIVNNNWIFQELQNNKCSFMSGSKMLIMVP